MPDPLSRSKEFQRTHSVLHVRETGTPRGDLTLIYYSRWEQVSKGHIPMATQGPSLSAPVNGPQRPARVPVAAGKGYVFSNQLSKIQKARVPQACR